MSQTSIILSVQQKLEDILAIQNVIVQNQHDMYDKLKDIEFRLVSVESRVARPAQQMPSTSTAKSGLLQPSSSSASYLPLWQSMRVKRVAVDSEDPEAKEAQETEKRAAKRARDDTEEGEVNTQESAAKEVEPAADDEPDEDSEADYDEDSTESSSTANITYSQKSTPPPPPPLTMHRSSMPHSILQSLATSSLLSSLQPRHADLALLATDDTTGTAYLDEPDIRRIFTTSKSRGNFSALLVQKLYTKDERVVSNVMGTRGKRQLSPNRMAAVRRLSFSLYPVGDEREEEQVWKKECVKAIDSKNRKVRTHHSVKSECASAPPGGISSTPPAPPHPRLLGNRPSFAIGLSPAHAASTSSANAFAIAMAAAAAAAVASGTSADNRSPKSDAKQQTEQHNS